MGLEATVVCIDSSDWMRNGDYTPTRMEAQHDAVNLIINAKTQSNPESTVGVVACGGKSPNVMVTLTTDIGKILTALHHVKLGGKLSLVNGIQVAQLVLKHRQNKNQQQRIVFFVGSPVLETEENLVQLGKKLRKNQVAVDIVNFGEETENAQKLEAFVNSVNSGENSHLVTVPPGPHVLSDILISSPIISEGGASGNFGGGDFDAYGGIDPSMDPELAMVLKMSMEEERARQDAANKKSSGETGGDVPATPVTPANTNTSSSAKSGGDEEMADAEDEDEMLKQAIAMSMAGGASTPSSTPSAPSNTSSSNAQSRGDVDMGEELTEEQEMQLALQMSMNAASGEQDMGEMMNDPNFVNSVLASLPGVDPNDEQIKNMLQNLQGGDKKEEKKEGDKK